MIRIGKPCSLLPLLLALLVGSPALAQEPPETLDKPNVLFLAIDDLNDWIGCLGGHPQVKTPHLDRLAARGTLFENAHCQSPVCNPSRTSVMTGLRPTTTGVYALQPWFRTVPKWKGHVSLPQHFAANGYHTLTLGKIYHGGSGAKGEFAEVGARAKLPKRFPKKKFVNTPQNHKLVDWGVWPPEDKDQLDFNTATWAVDRLKKEADKPTEDGKPFFMAVGFFRPHVPLYASQKWFDLYPEDEVMLPTTLENDRADTPRHSWTIHWSLPEPRLQFLQEKGQWTNKVRAYLASVSFVDAQVGRVLDALEAGGFADNTIVACWSDHGYHLGEKEITGKNTLWDNSTRVPMMFAGPGIAKGARCKEAVELLDLYPTLSALCDLEDAPANLEGLSLVPQLTDAATPRERPAITCHGPDAFGVRTETHRYIRYGDGSEEVYDMATDRDEFHNLAAMPEVADLKKELAAWLPKDSTRPVAGSKSRLIETRSGGSVYWENNLIDPSGPIPEYSE